MITTCRYEVRSTFPTNLQKCELLHGELPSMFELPSARCKHATAYIIISTQKTVVQLKGAREFLPPIFYFSGRFKLLCPPVPYNGRSNITASAPGGLLMFCTVVTLFRGLRTVSQESDTSYTTRADAKWLYNPPHGGNRVDL